MKILKRSGIAEDFNASKLQQSLQLAGAPDPNLIVTQLIKNPKDTQDLFDRAQLLMLNLVTEDLKWHDAARNYLLWSVYKQVWGKGTVKAINEGYYRLEDVYRGDFNVWFRTGLELGLWDAEMAKYYEPHIEELGKYIDPDRDLLLTYNGVRTLMSRYLLKRLDGTFFEAPQYLWMRTAMGVAYAELKYGGDLVAWARRYYDLISQLKFMPNSPTLYNAFTNLGQLSACFVVPVDDCLSIDSPTNKNDANCGFGIMDALRLASLIFQSGGGVGYNFGKLRPEGDIVKSTTGVASGPLSFMRLFDSLVDTIKQGGKRRGAQMGMMFWWHPDIEKFITAKSGESKDTHLQNFNISVVIDDYFMSKVANNENVYLINPRECPCLYKTWGEEFVKCYESCIEQIKMGKVRIWKEVNARELWNKIVESAWDSGDPGLWNKDVANQVVGYRVPGQVINATNPCGEEALYDFESCNLGSINLARYVDSEVGTLKWGELFEDVELAVRFLDDVIDVNKMPDERLKQANLDSRRIGLGINGLADTLIWLGIKYDSPEAVAFSDLVAKFVNTVATHASAKLASEKGSFPLFKASKWALGILVPERHWGRLSKFKEDPAVIEYFGVLNNGYQGIVKHVEWANKVLEVYGINYTELKEMVMNGMRNGSIMSIAPEGSRSLIAGVNSSIEPLFAIAYVRNLTIGKLVEYNLTALKLLRETNTLDEETKRYIEEHGTLPPSHPLANLLRTAHEIHWKWHVYMQVTWARWNDSGVSKTINLPSTATKEDVDNAFKLAWLLGAFGVTVYRDQSKSVQVIYTGTKQASTTKTTVATSLTAMKEKLEAMLDDPPSEAIEEQMKRELGETDDPYCKTGSCG
jgi:ribonucleoside-diphosphate reductase alpha chain